MKKSDLQIGDQVAFDGLVGRVVALGPKASVSIARGPTHEVPYAKLTLRKRRKHRKTPSKATREARARTGDPTVVVERPKGKAKKPTISLVEQALAEAEPWAPAVPKKKKKKAAQKPRARKPRARKPLGKSYAQVYMAAHDDALAAGFTNEDAHRLAKEAAEGTSARADTPRPRKGKRRPAQPAPEEPSEDPGSLRWSKYLRIVWPLHNLNTPAQRARYKALTLDQKGKFIDHFERALRSTLQPHTTPSAFEHAMDKVKGAVRGRPAPIEFGEEDITLAQARPKGFTRTQLIAERAAQMKGNPGRPWPKQQDAQHRLSTSDARKVVDAFRRRLAWYGLGFLRDGTRRSWEISNFKVLSDTAIKVTLKLDGHKKNILLQREVVGEWVAHDNVPGGTGSHIATFRVPKLKRNPPRTKRLGGRWQKRMSEEDDWGPSDTLGFATTEEDLSEFEKTRPRHWTKNPCPTDDRYEVLVYKGGGQRTCAYSTPSRAMANKVANRLQTKGHSVFVWDSSKRKNPPYGLTAKGERMYEHIKKGYGRYPRAKEIAARTVYARAKEKPSLHLRPRPTIRKVR